MQILNFEPQKITIRGNRLEIQWSSGESKGIAIRTLRLKCPCATCLAEKSVQSASYIPLYNPDQLSIVKIEPVGSYAINIVWKDGHNTGIYEFKGLHAMAEE